MSDILFYIALQIVSKHTCKNVSHTLTHRGPVTQYGDGSTLCKNPLFFTMTEFPQI